VWDFRWVPAIHFAIFFTRNIFEYHPTNVNFELYTLYMKYKYNLSKDSDWSVNHKRCAKMYCKTNYESKGFVCWYTNMPKKFFWPHGEFLFLTGRIIKIIHFPYPRINVSNYDFCMHPCYKSTGASRPQIVNIQSNLYIKVTQGNLKMYPLWAVTSLYTVQVKIICTIH
jgi:hypothetical protein